MTTLSTLAVALGSTPQQILAAAARTGVSPVDSIGGVPRFTAGGCTAIMKEIAETNISRMGLDEVSAPETAAADKGRTQYSGPCLTRQILPPGK